jgi:hypothetical protein
LIFFSLAATHNPQSLIAITKMKLALILLTLLPVILSMTIPLDQDDNDDAHGEVVRRIRLQSLGKPDDAVGESGPLSFLIKIFNLYLLFIINYYDVYGALTT